MPVWWYQICQINQVVLAIVWSPKTKFTHQYLSASKYERNSFKTIAVLQQNIRFRSWFLNPRFCCLASNKLTSLGNPNCSPLNVCTFIFINIKRDYILQLQHYQQNNELIYTNFLFIDNKWKTNKNYLWTEQCFLK